MKKMFLLLSGSVLIALTGCGSSRPAADFTLAAAPTTVSLVNGGPPQSLVLTASPVNGFTDTVNVAVSGLPAGVTATPTTVSVTPGQLAQVTLTAASASLGQTSNLTLTGTSGTMTHSITAGLKVAPATTVTLSTESFDFGADLVGNSLTESVVTLTNSGAATLSLQPTVTGDASFALASSQTCSTSLAPGASCSVAVSYTPTTVSGATPQSATLSLGFDNAPVGTPATVTLTGTSVVLPAGTISTTNNPQVALYTMNLPLPGAVTVRFGPDTTYGRSTWTQSTAVAGPVSILVAGMLANTTYHLQAAVQFTNGLGTVDADHTFATKAPAQVPSFTVSTTAGLVPQPGVEEVTAINGVAPGLDVTDLQGNLLWSYVVPGGGTGSTIEGSKLLPNGHFLLCIGNGSAYPLTGAAFGIDAIREIDLAGNTIREITMTDLNGELSTAGYNLTLQQFHHDIAALPNGHWLVLANTLKSFTDLTGYPGVTNVLGDVVVDLDTNLQPVWVWNEFDHLDVNRHPFAYLFPDWTHSNAVVYSPDDGNFLISIRHQNWVLKVDYKNGTGAGDILWRLGEGGDFTLKNGVDPTDWNYAQHYPSYFSTNTSGVFSLGLMDNGNDRIFPAGVTCNATGEPPCTYTTIPVFQIDEGAKTATLTYHQVLPASLYSDFGGNTELLLNGDIEYDLAGTDISDSDIFEVTPGSTPQTVWHLHSEGFNLYRGYRMPSLYPGVQW